MVSSVLRPPDAAGPTLRGSTTLRGSGGPDRLWIAGRGRRPVDVWWPVRGHRGGSPATSGHDPEHQERRQQAQAERNCGPHADRTGALLDLDPGLALELVSQPLDLRHDRRARASARAMVRPSAASSGCRRGPPRRERGHDRGRAAVTPPSPSAAGPGSARTRPCALARRRPAAERGRRGAPRRGQVAPTPLPSRRAAGGSPRPTPPRRGGGRHPGDAARSGRRRTQAATPARSASAGRQRASSRRRPPAATGSPRAQTRPRRHEQEHDTPARQPRTAPVTGRRPRRRRSPRSTSPGESRTPARLEAGQADGWPSRNPAGRHRPLNP